MKKEIRKIITIIKAAPNLKANITTYIIMLGLGVLSFVQKNSIETSKLCLITCTSFIHQTIMTASGSGLIQSSSSAKRMQTFYPFIIEFPCSIIIYTILAFNYVHIAGTPSHDMSLADLQTACCWFIITYSFIIAAIHLIKSFSYKRFGLGMICAILAIIPFLVIIFNFETNNRLHLHSSLTLTNAVIIGYLIVISGFLLSPLIANRFYNYPISAHVMKANTKA